MKISLLSTPLLFSLSTAFNPPPLPSLAPWEVTSLYVWTPPGRPGEHPLARISLSISDPNTIKLGQTPWDSAVGFGPTTATCSVRWLYVSASRGFFDPVPCGDVNTALWSVSYHPNTTSASTNFGLRFALQEAVILRNGAIEELKFEGEGWFKVGYGNSTEENMSGSCGGSGQCGWGLRADRTPVIVEQQLVSRTCLVGDCQAAYNA